MRVAKRMTKYSCNNNRSISGEKFRKPE